jgi:hypothetical protein
MESALFVRQRTIHKTWIALCSAAIMLNCYMVLIPLWAGLGAALATLIGLASHACITYAVTHRLFPVEYQWTRLAGMLGLAIGLWLLAMALPAALWAILLKSVLWLSWPILLWHLGWILPEEKEFARHLLRQTREHWECWRGRGMGVVASPWRGQMVPDRAAGHPGSDVVLARGWRD